MSIYLACFILGVRLSGGYGNAGRVEVYHNGQWGTICDDYWDINDARVVCKQLGFEDALKPLRDSYYDMGTGNIWMDQVNCKGSESSLFSCEHRGWGNHDCSHTQDAGVSCKSDEGKLRLVNGSYNEGRVEIYYNDTWGTVCDSSWDIRDARVFCRKLGFQDAEAAYQGAHFGQGTGPIWLDQVECTGYESSLLPCLGKEWGNHSCNHSQDVGVRCKAKDDVLRLVGGSYNERRVEFYYKGAWGTICSVFWAINDARVVCRQLGFQDAEVAYKDAYFGEGTGPIWINSLNCKGYESLVTSCPQSRWYFQSNCNHSKDVGVRCKGIRDVHSGKSENNVTSQPDGKSKNITSESGGKSEQSRAGVIAGGITGAILFVIIVVGILLFAQRKILRKQHEISLRELHALHVIRRRRTNAGTRIAEQPPLPPEAQAETLPDTAEVIVSYVTVLEDWNIAPDNLILLNKKLGEGQFGIVRQGLLTTGKCDSEIVAVKTLKDCAKNSDIEDLMAELTILKEVNKIPHPNVVRFIGGCSIQGRLHIVTEFCSGGSLRHLLIKSRVNPTKNSQGYINMTSTLNHRELLKFAVDVANGMVHLSSQKASNAGDLVHRDLAARNILICGDKTAKISDFGLARDIKGVEEYIRSNHNLLPIKWMALESLFHGHFITASDVWSYGIFLHEITTLGEEPYKNIPPDQVITRVGCGYRMPQPPQCSKKLYEIMTRCWQAEPTERPTFEEIYELLHSMVMDNEKSHIKIVQSLDEGSLNAAQMFLEWDLSSDEESNEKSVCLKKAISIYLVDKINE